MGFDMVECGLRVKAIRISKGLTQEQLADELDISRPHLTLMEVGKKGWSVDMLVHFAEKYDVSLDYLLLGRKSEGDKVEKIKNILRKVIRMLLDLVDSL